MTDWSNSSSSYDLKTQEKFKNASETANNVNSGIDTVSSNVNTQTKLIPPPPHQYYYQPFTPPQPQPIAYNYPNISNTSNSTNNYYMNPYMQNVYSHPINYTYPHMPISYIPNSNLYPHTTTNAYVNTNIRSNNGSSNVIPSVNSNTSINPNLNHHNQQKLHKQNAAQKSNSQKSFPTPKAVQQQLKRPAPVPEPTTKKFSAHQQISNLVFSYNLDDPEELEKWKAERRKKFPKKEKEMEKEVEMNLLNSAKLIPNSSFDIEEGALDDDINDNININNNNVGDNDTSSTAVNGNVILKNKKRFCKYFAKGKCNKGENCPFEHSQSSNSHKTTTTTLSNNRPTIFENLLKIEENESMLRFYECIKHIVNFNKNF